MSHKLPPVVLIAGTFCNPEIWDEMKAELEQRGHEVHALPLRYHDLPFLEGARKMANVSLNDYVDDFVELINTLEAPPIIMGWSLGGLIAQLVAQKVEHAGLVLLSPAPAAGVFALYPSMIKTFSHVFMQWEFWRKPLYPELNNFLWSVANLQDEADMLLLFDKLKAESGRAYFEMVFWFLDKNKAATVYPEKIDTPVLVIAGHNDRIVRYPIGRATAKRFSKGEFVKLDNTDHVLVLGKFLPKVLKEYDRWMIEKNLTH